MKIGIDLGGSHIAIGVIDKNGTIIEKVERRILKEDKKTICSIIENYIVENVTIYKSKYKINSIGIAIPGTVNNKKIIKSVNLGIENYNIVDKLSKKLDLPIKIKNDAKCAALAENEYGSMKKYKRSLFLTLGTGIGGAVIINNELLDTGDLPGVEVGHMIIKKDGLKCNCGNKGCFEKYASMKAFKTNLRKALKVDENTSGKELLDVLRDWSQTFGDTSQKFDVNITKVVDDFIEYLSIGIANLVNIFEPEAVVIGGSFVNYKVVLLDKLKQILINGPYLFKKIKNIIIKKATLGNDAGIIGASLI
ncbi:MAG: ROK family protein [Clostridia bacterium]|nr:ROK family protein [Clostridia bacterium]